MTRAVKQRSRPWTCGTGGAEVQVKPPRRRELSAKNSQADSSRQREQQLEGAWDDP